MSEENLNLKAREALRHIRNWIMHYGAFPSVRELMSKMQYKSPRSISVLLTELETQGFLQKKQDGSYRILKDLEQGEAGRTVSVPLVGSAPCGSPLLAEENIEAMIQVSVLLAKPGHRYFILRAIGDSMDKAGIQNGDLMLVRQQATADNGQKVVALLDDSATVKELQHKGDFVALIPRSNNPKHQPIILTQDFQIQGIVIATIPH